MIIVDTFNVLHAARGVDVRLGGLTVESFEALLVDSRFRGEAIVLVLDGTGGGLAGSGWAGGGGGGGVKRVFAGPGRDADSMIERMLDEQERLGAAHRCTVVSSDRRLKVAAAGVRARWMSSGDFIRAILDDAIRQQSNARRDSGDRSGAAAREGLDPDSTRHWLREFGLDGSPGSPESGPPARVQPSGTMPDVPPNVLPVDPLLCEALDEWSGRLSLDDLDMAKWLKDEHERPHTAPPPDPPVPPSPKSGGGQPAARKKRSRRKPDA